MPTRARRKRALLLGVHALYPLFRPLLFALDPETRARCRVRRPRSRRARAAWRNSRLPALPPAPVEAMGFAFPIASVSPRVSTRMPRTSTGLATLGFGFIEAGTVTPRAQPGNPRPRMFRVAEAQALINRLGFNNGGVDALRRQRRAIAATAASSASTSARTSTRRTSAPPTTTSPACAPCTRTRSYVTVNISSPNTKGLRDLQAEEALAALLARLEAEQDDARAEARAIRAARGQDRTRSRRRRRERGVARLLVAHRLDGVIATNTTIARDGVAGLAARGRGRRPVRRAAARALDGGGARRSPRRWTARCRSSASAASSPATDARAEDRRGRDARAALHGAHLPRAGSRRRVRPRARQNLTTGSSPEPDGRVVQRVCCRRCDAGNALAPRVGG